MNRAVWSRLLSESDIPAPAELLRRADAQWRALSPIGHLEFWAAGMKFRAVFAYPGVLRVHDFDTGGCYAESLVGQPTAPAWTERPHGGRF